jgi:hypothetical protein
LCQECVVAPHTSLHLLSQPPVFYESWNLFSRRSEDKVSVDRAKRDDGARQPHRYRGTRCCRARVVSRDCNRPKISCTCIYMHLQSKPLRLTHHRQTRKYTVFLLRICCVTDPNTQLELTGDVRPCRRSPRSSQIFEPSMVCTRLDQKSCSLGGTSRLSPDAGTATGGYGFTLQ